MPPDSCAGFRVPDGVGQLKVRDGAIVALSTEGLIVVGSERTTRFRVFPDLEGEPVVRRSRPGL